MADNKKSKKEIFFKFLTDWGLVGLAILIIVSYAFISTQTDKYPIDSIWVNIIFIILNLLAAFYIARQVSLWGWKTENASNQKKIAKTAIRHNRSNLTSIVKLIKITKGKIEITDEPLTKQYLTEIRNHLEMIYNGIKNSEADFNEIVNEELEEQNTLEFEITELLDEIDDKNKELNQKNSQQKEDKEIIKELHQTIKEKEREIATKVSNLPFGSNSYLTGSTYNTIDEGGILLGRKNISIFDTYGLNKKKE